MTPSPDLDNPADRLDAIGPANRIIGPWQEGQDAITQHSSRSYSTPLPYASQ